ncbi:MAG TPA: homocysteine S-methyltransferase family protein [Gammaproteobacteria bacterium]|nr:homocysteine S-methyltransferase family protein [Gammaproteobacteria bacterium]
MNRTTGTSVEPKHRHFGWAGTSVGHAELAAQARGWIDAGARIVGGCCGTTPEHIRALAALRAVMSAAESD